MANKKEKRLAMVLDPRKCIDCKACDVACKRENQIFAGGNQEIRRNRVNSCGIEGTYPKLKMSFEPEQCHQCANPPCVSVCPVDATYSRPDGVVAIDKKECIGCAMCIEECPYGARYLEAKGTADKCDFCSHRVAAGKLPACVETCPTNVRTFGDLKDPQSKAAKLLKENKHRVLREELGTRPNLFYIS